MVLAGGMVILPILSGDAVQFFVKLVLTTKNVVLTRLYNLGYYGLGKYISELSYSTGFSAQTYLRIAFAFVGILLALAFVLSCLKRDTETGAELVVWEVPLLFESGLDQYCDEVWTVSASEETRIERVIQRDGCSRAAAKKRILAQATEEERNERADVILRNDGDVAAVIRAVDERLNARRKLP